MVLMKSWAAASSSIRAISAMKRDFLMINSVWPFWAIVRYFSMRNRLLYVFINEQ